MRIKGKSKWNKIIGEPGPWGFFVLFLFSKLFSNKKGFANSKTKTLDYSFVIATLIDTGWLSGMAGEQETRRFWSPLWTRPFLLPSYLLRLTEMRSREHCTSSVNGSVVLTVRHGSACLLRWLSPLHTEHFEGARAGEGPLCGSSPLVPLCPAHAGTDQVHGLRLFSRVAIFVESSHHGISIFNDSTFYF